MDPFDDENMFDVGEEKRKTSIMIPTPMDEALAILGKKRNLTVNGTILMLLERALKQLVREGVLPRPKK